MMRSTRLSFIPSGVRWVLATTLLAQNPSGPFPRPEAKCPSQLERIIAVPMRDGVVLRADLYRPTGEAGKLPVVLLRTPYDKAAYQDNGVPRPNGVPTFFAGQGYAVVVQDVRGQF